MMDDIDSFEASQPWNRRTRDPAVANHTATDWTMTRPSQRPCDARPSPTLRIQFEDTAASGWLLASGEEVAPSPFQTHTSEHAWARTSGGMRATNGSIGSALLKTSSSFFEERSPKSSRSVTFASEDFKAELTPTKSEPRSLGPSGLSLRKLQPSSAAEAAAPEEVSSKSDFSNTLWSATVKGDATKATSDEEAGKNTIKLAPLQAVPETPLDTDE